MKEVILMTACVNPNGMTETNLQNPEIRLLQYKRALSWYLTNTTHNIVFVENTGVNLEKDYKKHIDAGRLEIFTFYGNDYKKELGKGYGEALIIEYALKHSAILANTDRFVKITGRLICKNINFLMKYARKRNFVYGKILFMKNRFWCESRIVIFPREIIVNEVMPRMKYINDSESYNLEHCLYDCIKNIKTLFPPIIYGQSGTSGKKIDTTFFRYLKDLVSFLLSTVGLYHNGFIILPKSLMTRKGNTKNKSI